MTQVLIPCMHQHACLTLELAEIFNASFYESTDVVVPRHPALFICCPGFRVEVNLGATNIRIWRPSRDKRSSILIGAGGVWRSDWPECVKAIGGHAGSDR